MHLANTRFIALASILTLLSASSWPQTGRQSNVEQAIAFLKAACVTGGSSLDIKVTGDGGLLLRNVLASGVKGSVTVTKKELEGFVDAASAVGGQQASEMRACMKPYIDKILSAMLSEGTASKPETISINADGNFFVTAEFDRVISLIASEPTRIWNTESLARESGVSQAKILLYISTAVANGLAGSVAGGEYMKVNQKGIKYALAKGLVK